MKQEEKSTIIIYLEGGEQITVIYPDEFVDELFSALHLSMKTGCLFSTPYEDIDLWYGDEYTGQLLCGVSGRKIIGYSY